MYRVLVAFCDGENGKPFPAKQGGVAYSIGETYPKDGFVPAPSHIAYLLGGENKLGQPLIEPVQEPPVQEPPVQEPPTQGADAPEQPETKKSKKE